MISTVMAFLGVRGGIAVALAIALTLSRCGASGMEEKINTLEAELKREVAAKDLYKDGLDTCVVVNARNTQAISSCRTAVGAIKAESERLSALAQHREHAILEASALINEADRKRRARVDAPSPSEMTQVLRDAMAPL